MLELVALGQGQNHLEEIDMIMIYVINVNSLAIMLMTVLIKIKDCRMSPEIK